MNTGPRFVITLVALFAFVLQGYLTQTHIHANTAKAWAGGTSTANALPSPAKKPIGPDEGSNCPICQSLIHAGSFIAPAKLSLYLPALAVGIVSLVSEQAHEGLIASHSWQGRAPPRR